MVITSREAYWLEVFGAVGWYLGTILTEFYKNKFS